jgi:tyrosyl-tRNA synthetase
MLLQAFDFYVLARDQNCTLQIGGSDQWGNITMGIDLIRKKLGRPAFGLTLPLITKADGTKFGKTESGAIWLDPKKTSSYRFYQFWVNVDDRDVVRYLKLFTFVGRDEVEALEAQHAADPGKRVAHRALAKAMTDLIHGEAATQEAIRASEALFSGNLASLPKETFEYVVPEVPNRIFPLKNDQSEFIPLGKPLYEVVAYCGLSGSKGQARKDIEGGGIYINDQKVLDPAKIVSAGDFLHDQHLALRKGKRNYFMISGSAPISGVGSGTVESSTD